DPSSCHDKEDPSSCHDKKDPSSCLDQEDPSSCLDKEDPSSCNDKKDPRSCNEKMDRIFGNNENYPGCGNEKTDFYSCHDQSNSPHEPEGIRHDVRLHVSGLRFTNSDRVRI